MKFDYIYDSSSQFYEKEYKIDYENEGLIVVLFAKENIILTVDAFGNTIFKNLNGEELYKDKAEGDRRYFSSVFCHVVNNTITVNFPIIETIDHYPNCDGEYDRYSERIVDKICIRYTVI